MKTKMVLYAYIMSGALIIFMVMLSDIMMKNTSGSSLRSEVAGIVYAENNIPYNAPNTQKSDSKSTDADMTEPVFDSTVEDVSDAQGSDQSGDEISIAVFSHESDKIIKMELEEYLAGVVMAEMPYTYEYEALKAQAVAARSYCVYRMNNGGVSQHDDADVCTSYAHCAAYISESEAAERWGSEKAEEIKEIISRAVNDTKGMIITYNGEPAVATFHASSYGYTESAVNLWGQSIPYLVSVKTPEADDKSEETISYDELYKKIGGKGSCPEKQIYLEKNDTGRINSLTLGDITIKAKDLRTALSLKSCQFEISENEDSVTFYVHGRGHGVGMSQVGANELAKQGKDFKTILTTYYTGVEIGSLR